MTQQLAQTRAFVIVIDKEVLLVTAEDREDAIRRLITDSMIKGREQGIAADDVTTSLLNGFIIIREVNGSVVAEPWNGELPEGL